MRLFRFVNTEKKNLDAFHKWYEEENKKSPTEFPNDLPEEEWYEVYEEWLNSEE